MKKIAAFLLSIGPGLFCIGYTVGTGSVTSMAKAGSQYGSQLLWVLALSCIFSWALMEAYGRYAVVTGRTAVNSFKTELKFGKVLAVVLIVGIVIGQWNSLSGIVGLSANALYEIARLFLPGLPAESYWAVLSIAVVILAILYFLLIVGKYSFFEKILILFVTIMGVSFLISMFIVLPPPGEIAMGFIPSIPEGEGGSLLVAAFVGTTMAAPTFVVRPLLMQGKGWAREHTSLQSRDALSSALLMFVISASIMVTAMGALYYKGLTINKVIDMVYTLEPVAGKFAVALFMTGALSAGLSSVFPILMVAPLLISDYKNGELDLKSKLFKRLTAVACVVGLSVPILGANPIAAQIATQVANVFVLPLVIGGIIYMVNRKAVMGEHRAGWLLNTGLVLAFIFSCVISVIGFTALKDFF
ncbi:Nramp family divalent metal transporter [Imperialibacter roseus]|uniref:Nramp family divalent metal transporter n=1 Tax=Imperialibacter roseus TaxID=1324217 RepID=A0ABZ0IL04_9BACT|nr:Nramp family divalent metal transporter [Imperialibacter roseus]WOK05700.1 Nramp family divalent metal transporter [Imperialibacter roseus]